MENNLSNFGYDDPEKYAKQLQTQLTIQNLQKSLGMGSSSDSLLGSITGSDTYKNIFGEDTGLMGAFGQGFNIYSFIKKFGLMDDYVDMMKEQLGMKREQMDITKNQLANMERYGNQVSYGYNHGGDYTDYGQGTSNPYYQQYGAGNTMLNTGANSMANQAAYYNSNPQQQTAAPAKPVWNNRQTLLNT